MNANDTLALRTGSPDARYDGATIWLHWISAALAIGLWLLGQVADWFPRGPARDTAWSVHVGLGLVLTLVLAVRLVWRGAFGRSLPPGEAGALQALARLTHLALYALLIAVVATGIANASYRGFNLFGLWTMPQFGSADRATRRMINEWHELASNLILFVSLFHAAAALFHHYVRRDGLLSRMR
jgi:cytochrome b561